jgi:calcium-dependent protein kinase
LKHEWFKCAGEFKNDDDKDPLDPDMLKNLLAFKGSSKLKKAAMNLFVKIVNEKEFDALRKQFEAIDVDHTGDIDAEEISKALKQSNLEIDEAQIDALIKEIDDAGNNMINYTEFLAATVTTKNLLNDNRLTMLFREFDTDDTGYITKENLEEAFGKLEKSVSSQEIQAILETHDIAKDGKISYEEFTKMLLGDDERLVEFK